MKCWVCGGGEVVYRDIVDMDWCDGCFESIYLNGSPYPESPGNDCE